MCLKINIHKHSIVKNPPSFTELKCYACETAEYNKKVYKVFIVNSCGTLQTPYQQMLINLDKLDNGLVTKEDLFLQTTFGYIFHAVHAFTKYKTAIKRLESIRLHSCLAVIVEMYIPKGTKLWYGEYDEIAAQKMCFYNKNKERLRKLVIQ